MKLGRLLAFAAAIAMLLFCIPQTAFAAYGYYDATYGDYQYDFNSDGTLTITGYTGQDSIVIIPDTIDGDRVTGIGDIAFFYCRSLTSVVIPDTVTSIGFGVFWRCESLESVHIPQGVESIGNNVFLGCTSLKEISVDAQNKYYVSVDGVLFNKDMTELIQYPLGKSDKSYAVPDSVININDSAFAGCEALTSIAIPRSVTQIAGNSFAGCSSLESISIDAQNDNYTIVDGILFNKSMTVLVQYPAKKSGKEYIVPNGVTEIDYCAFCYCADLTSVEIPESVQTIHSSAFEYCTSLTSIKMSEGLKTIDEYAFMGCNALTSVVIPGSVTSIGDYAFYGCESLVSVTIPDSVTGIEREAFYDCPGTLVIHGSTGSYAETYANDCNITFAGDENTAVDGVLFSKDMKTLIKYPSGKMDTSYVIPDGVTRIETGAFGYCYFLESVVIPDSVTSIGEAAFGECSNLKSVVISDSVTVLSDYMFAFCKSLESVKIPDSVTEIGFAAFAGCESLVSVEIPAVVTSIGDYAFGYSFSLTKINVDAQNKNYTSVDGILFNKDKTELIKYPSSKSGTSYTIPDGVTSISDNAFEICNSLKTVEIPDSVTSIGGWAFYGCESLTSVYIPAAITGIGEYAFGYCYSLTAINVDPMNKNYVSVDGILFNKDKTELIKYPSSKSGTSYTIPDGVTSISDNAFDDCVYLKTVIISDSVTDIGSWAFYGCESLTSVEIPESVTAISDYAFDECPDLILYVTSGSYAENYAKRNFIPFSVLKKSVGILGDVDGNGIVNALDAAMILRAAVKNEPLDSAAADVNGDGRTDALDAAAILRQSVVYI